jgi:hypothetical protein
MEPVPNRAPNSYSPEQSAWLEEAHKFTDRMTSPAETKKNYGSFVDIANRGSDLFGSPAKMSDALTAYKASKKGKKK